MPVPPAFVAPIIIGVVEVAVDVPEIRPVAVLIERPGGSPVAENEVGLFDAVIWKEYPVPARAIPLKVPFVITGFGTTAEGVVNVLSAPT